MGMAPDLAGMATDLATLALALTRESAALRSIMQAALTDTCGRPWVLLQFGHMGESAEKVGVQLE